MPVVVSVDQLLPKQAIHFCLIEDKYLATVHDYQFQTAWNQATVQAVISMLLTLIP